MNPAAVCLAAAASASEWPRTAVRSSQYQADDAKTPRVGIVSCAAFRHGTHLAHYRVDGTVWHRRLWRDGTLTPAEQLVGTPHRRGRSSAPCCR